MREFCYFERWREIPSTASSARVSCIRDLRFAAFVQLTWLVSLISYIRDDKQIQTLLLPELSRLCDLLDFLRSHQYKSPCHCVPLLKRGRIKTSSERWGFIIECLSCEISHKHKRGVLYESRIMLNNEWCGFCCSGRFFWRISIIKSSHFFEIVVSEITRSSFCTSYSISWTSTKPESSNGIVTHDTSTDIELIDSFNFYNR